MHVVIVGGGLAGIAAALRLADHGIRVTLVETRKRLGGRATSFVDPASGQLLDNCQHVLLKCCTNLLDLYRRLGVDDRIEWHDTMYFWGKDVTVNRGASNASSTRAGRRAPLPGYTVDVLASDDLPAPAHMSRAMLAFRTLTWGEKIAISSAMVTMMHLTARQRAALNDISFEAWLRQQNQPQGAIDKFWAIVVISAINELPDRMGADYAIQVFREGFLASETAYVMGLPRVTLVELYDAAEKRITETGGSLMLSTSAEGFEYEHGRVSALRIDGGRRLEADAFVSAVPFDRLAKLATPAMIARDSRMQRLDEIGVSPIVGVHLWLGCPDGQPVMTLPHLVMLDSPVQWVFNKGVEASPPTNAGDASGAKSPVQHLHAVISAAHDLVDTPADEILAMVSNEIRKALNVSADEAPLVHGRAVKEKRATFSARPGFEALRPEARGAISNLYLAGDWCRSGWPATMEGATRSGYLAAAALLNDAGVASEALMPELRHAALYSFISG